MLLRTAVINTTRNADGSVASITVVQRTPRPAYREWSMRFSDIVDDWCASPHSPRSPRSLRFTIAGHHGRACRYTPTDSAYFTKEVMVLSGSVFIEATEFGDVLATSGLP